ncbi:MAG: hypothetical protein ACE5OY_02630 [Candidatus Bathyarchaeia archaeon]
MQPREVAASSVCAALYAGVGYLTYLGIFTPVIGVVRFWPAVVIPAIFGVLFGPMVGGIGAAIGIFISDIVIHGNALLSLSVGVTSNFVAFYLIGYLSRKRFNWMRTILGLGGGCVIITVIAYLMSKMLVLKEVAWLFIGVCIGSYLLIIVFGYLWPEWRSYGVGSVIGLGVGSSIVGFGVWAFSQLFVLPSNEFQLPLYASLIWFVWTFSTEIPFLIVIVPPVLRVCYKVFPVLAPQQEAYKTT